jgi:hypothetical protein
MEMWTPYGVLTQWKATKIQKTWRGLLGRRAGYQQYLWYRGRAACRIQGLSALFQARRWIRKLRAEAMNRLTTVIQRSYRGRLGRQAYLEFKMGIYNKMALRIQRCAQRYMGLRRFNGIKRRMDLAYGSMTEGLRRDYENSEGYKKKITIEKAEVGGLDKWALYDAALVQLLGTHRQEIGLDIATVLARRHSEMALAPVILFVSLFFQWSSYTPRKMVREDLLEEALEVLQVIRERSDELLVELDLADEAIQDDLPHGLRGADRVSFHRVTSLLEEMEYSYFRSMFKRHHTDPYCLCLMASFAIAKSAIYEKTRPKDAEKEQERARRLLKRAVAKTRNVKEDLYLRNQVFDNLFNPNAKVKEVVLKPRQFSECFLVAYKMPRHDDPPRKIDHTASGRAHLGAQPRVTTNIRAIQYREMLVIKAEYDLTPLAASLRKSKLTIEDLGYKWRRAMYIRPMVVLARDVRGLETKAVTYIMKLLRKNQFDVEKRGLLKNVGEYLCDHVRLVACKTRVCQDHRPTAEDEFAQLMPPGWDSQFTHTRLALPFMEYRHIERNLAAAEDYGIRMIQRSYLGFQGRALFRRLYARFKEKKRQKCVTDAHNDRLNAVRATRFGSATIIQAVFRGYIWRKELAVMHYSALLCQTRFRVFKAQCWYYEERRRLALGPEVIEMLRRGVEISGRRVTLVIYRCGNNYKCLGEDLLNNLRYDGHVYAPELPAILDDHNREVFARLGDTPAAKAEKVSIWQHEKVADAIANVLALTKMIMPVTRELGIGKRDTKMCLVPVKTAVGHGILDNTKLERFLEDQEHVYRRFKKTEAYKEKVRAELAKGGPTFDSKYG